MQLRDSEVGVAFSVAGYEFPGQVGRWDRDWLYIEGVIRSGGRTWSFASPCLQTHEAKMLADWLESAAHDGVQPVGDTELGSAWRRSYPHRHRERMLTFLEPDLGFSVRESSDDIVVIRVHLGHAAADPDLADDDRMAEPAPWVPISTTRHDLARAAQEWRREIQAWPPR